MKQSMLFLALLFTATYSHGFISTQKIQKSLEKAAQKRSPVKASQDKNKCTDFQGSWKGVCENSEGKTEETVNIQQSGCTEITSISSNGSKESYDLTGVGINSKSSSAIMASYGITYAARWSDDQKVIQLEAGVVVNSPLFSAPMAQNISAQVMLDGNDLLVFTKSLSSSEGDIESSCRYKKVN